MLAKGDVRVMDGAREEVGNRVFPNLKTQKGYGPGIERDLNI